jgi:hypothetical protein
MEVAAGQHIVRLGVVVGGNQRACRSCYYDNETGAT